MTSRRVNGSLTHRLVLAQVAVIAAMTVTMVVAALIVGPAVFDQHMHEAGHGEQPQLLAHAQEAFRSAGLASMGERVTGVSVCGPNPTPPRRCTASSRL